MKLSWLIAGILIAAGALSVVMALMFVLPIDLTEHSPVQPLAFSHKVHAGVNAIPCLFCHRSAPKSPVAGIPAMGDCRGCHLYIANDTPEIKKLLELTDNKKTIQWVRVNDLPDHVYFPHMMHLRANIACSDCHGDVAAMERVRRTASLKMGWCLNCHRQHRASIDCWTCHI
jgi:hypothetical protein